MILARLLADITAFVTLALLCGLGLGLCLGLQELRAHWTVYAGVYAVIAACAWWVLWRPDRDGTVIPWSTMVLGSIALGAAFFVCDMAIGRLTHADLPRSSRAGSRGRPPGFWRHAPGLPRIDADGALRLESQPRAPPCDPFCQAPIFNAGVIE